jgi:prevent-host-death family protein
MTKSSTIRVGVHEAKTRFSELLRSVAVGQEVEILKNGVPIARLVPSTAKTLRTFGSDVGSFVVPDDFDAALPDDIIVGFEG